MAQPKFEDLGPELQKVLSPEKAKMWPMIAKGIAPLPPTVLISAWAYFLDSEEPTLKSLSENSLRTYPEASLVSILTSESVAWILSRLGIFFLNNENVLEAILLNDNSPNDLFLSVAPLCSERIAVLISNNQERIIEQPQIIPALEKNPLHLKSNTEKLRHFLRLSGISIPGESSLNPEDDIVLIDDAAFTSAEFSEFDDDQKAKALFSKGGGGLTDEQRQSLLQYVQKLSVGGRAKLALKGNKEARALLIRDTNNVVSLSVLKSPRLTDGEVAIYASMRNVSDDVIRTISNNPSWVRNYQTKLALCFHPKTPFQSSMTFIKFLNMRDLVRLTRDKNAPGALVKASKQLLSIKRK